MKIMSDREYERRICEAEERGAQRASRQCFEERERERMQENVWRELGEIRRGFAHELDRIESKADMLAGELGVEFKNDPPKGPTCTTPF